MMILSSAEPLRQAASVPTTRLPASMRTIAQPVASSVHGRRSRITSSTGLLKEWDSPSCPEDRLPSQVAYCSSSGLSRPHSALILATTSGEVTIARSPRYWRTGSKGSWRPARTSRR
ncbi:hypothetical protein [Nonomuraea recticatena]|uniref:hypothetical protein n=1 Tax=Nonomuraea recticatena TaxID=46178 RepID=UPI003609ECF4